MDKKVKIIYDTDIGGDCDDAGTLAMLHRLCDAGECELLAVTACYASPYVAGCIDAINRYYGRIVPVGINYSVKNEKPGVYARAICEKFPNSYPAESYAADGSFPDSCRLLRKLLSEAEDNSITLVATGDFTTLGDLVKSEPDDISPLNGSTLIEKKILRTVVMGGRFFATWPMPIIVDEKITVIAEWNVRGDISAAKIVCDKWPGELVFSSYEIGLYCVTMAGFSENGPEDNPVRLAYQLHPRGRVRGRESWDQTAMLYAVRPDAGYWNLHPYGRIVVADNGVTTWHSEEGGHQTYLLPREDYEVIRQIIDHLAQK